MPDKESWNHLILLIKKKKINQEHQENCVFLQEQNKKTPKVPSRKQLSTVVSHGSSQMDTVKMFLRGVYTMLDQQSMK